MPGGRPTVYKPEYCEQVIELGKEGRSIRAIAVRIGHCYRTIYTWMEKHPEFLHAVKKSQDYALDFFEEKLISMAEGTHKRNTEAGAIYFTLKSRFKQIYSERVEIAADVKVNPELKIHLDGRSS